MSGYSQAAVLQWHGIGQSSIPKLNTLLQSKGLAFNSKAQPATVTKPSDPEQVNAYMKALQHPLKNVATALREIILSAHKDIGEEICWNAPFFFYTGAMKPFNPKEYKRFVAGFNFFKKDCVRLVFLTGAKLNDESGMLEGDYADGRRLALFHNLQEVKLREKTLRLLVKKWVLLLDK